MCCNIWRPASASNCLQGVDVRDIGCKSFSVLNRGRISGTGITFVFFHRLGTSPLTRNDALKIAHTGLASHSAISRKTQFGSWSGPGGFQMLMFVWQSPFDCADANDKLIPNFMTHWWNHFIWQWLQVTGSDISVSKINFVSVTVFCVTGSFSFLLYFSFEILFRFSFSCHFSNHSYFSFSFYFRFRVHYIDQ